MTAVVSVARPADVSRRAEGLIRRFPGGQGKNHCPAFYYLADGFGCVFDCQYCYLRRFEYNHPDGAVWDADTDKVLHQVERFLRAPEPRSLLVGEVTDAWGWAKTRRAVLHRCLRLIEAFAGQARHTLVFLTKAGFVAQLLRGVTPAPQVVLSWSVNSPAAAAAYEMGAGQAADRLLDAAACKGLGWRVRCRLDPMIPLAGWQDEYARLAEQIAELGPEQVTIGSWRPRPRDPAYRAAPAELRAQLDPGPDGRLRLRDRIEGYRLVGAILRHRVELSLCKEDLALVQQLYAEWGLERQACNCLAAPVPLDFTRRHLPVLQEST